MAVTDSGAFADPGRRVGETLELAGDELSRDALVAAIGRAMDRPVDVEPIPAERRAELGLGETDTDAVDSFAGWRADIPALHPELTDFGTWLEREGKAQFEALFATTWPRRPLRCNVSL
ncbi:hypothetical protein JYK22_09010, partial [Nonomuraea sp. RK-328]|nr:hypothetical protein [Nonomuraea sp. RK-328]